MAEFREGDWECPECGAHCFASRATCFKCDKKAGGGGGGGGERREGDWDCPDCGMLVFASKEACPKCEKGGPPGGGGGAGNPAFREGDWECPDCGGHNFASRETCFACEKATGGGGGSRREGDWDCPECGALVFASKDSCFRCSNVKRPGAAAKGGGGKAKGKGGKAGAKGASGILTSNGKGVGVTSLAGVLKTMPRLCKDFEQAWNSYCDVYFEGFHDPSSHESSSLDNFFKYAAGLIEKDLQSAGEPEAVPAAEPEAAPAQKPAVGQKRAAAKVPPGAPADKKKITVKKTVADKIKSLNASGTLMAEIRLGAIAAVLCQLDEQVQLETLELLEGQAEEIEDPNEFLRSQAQAMLDEA